MPHKQGFYITKNAPNLNGIYSLNVV